MLAYKTVYDSIYFAYMLAYKNHICYHIFRVYAIIYLPQQHKGGIVNVDRIPKESQ